MSDIDFVAAPRICPPGARAKVFILFRHRPLGQPAWPPAPGGRIGMIIDCSNFRNLIPRALLSDLTGEQQQALEAHLKDCPPCAQEQDLYLNTFDQLRSADDVPV